jgi:hypothetical protein
MAGQSVTMLVFAPSRSRSGLPDFDRQQLLGPDGTTTFHLTSVPADGSILLIGIDPDWCSPTRYTLEEVLTVGAADYYNCRHRSIKKYTVKPKPSQIVVYMGEYSRARTSILLPMAVLSRDRADSHLQRAEASGVEADLGPRGQPGADFSGFAGLIDAKTARPRQELTCQKVARKERRTR